MTLPYRRAVFAHLPFAVSVVVALALPIPAPGDDVTVEWVLKGNGDWQEAAHWSTGLIPNNSSDRYFVAISGDPDDVSVFLANRPPANVAVSALTIGSGDALNIGAVLRINTAKTSASDPSGLIANQGTIELGNNSLLVVNVNTESRMGDTVTLSGGGRVVLNEPFQNISNRGSIITGGAEQPRTLLIQDQIIEGTGQIGQGELRIINKKEIVANRPNSALIIDPGAGSLTVPAVPGDYTNDGGTARATGGGILQLVAGTFNNINGGTFVAENNSFVDLAFGAHVHGGLLQSSGTGRFRVTGDAFLNGTASTGLTVATDVDVQDGNDLVLQGSITNLDITTLTANARVTSILVDENASVAGSGIIRLDTSRPDLNRAQIGALNPDAELTVGPGQRIEGTGSIEGSLTVKNQGTLSANVQGRTLTIRPTGGNTLENTQTLQAEDGGSLHLLSSWNLNGGTGTGTIQAWNDSEVVLDGVTIENQVLKTPDNLTAVDPMASPDSDLGVIRTRGVSSTLDVRAAPIKNQGLLEIANGSGVSIQGSVPVGNAAASALENSGTILFNAIPTPGFADLNIRGGDVRLTGGGRVVLSDSARNRITQSHLEPRTHVLINVDNTIAGGGNIGERRLNFRNEVQGIVRANSATPLVIEPSSAQPNDILPGVAQNLGTWEAVQGGELMLRGGRIENIVGGTIRASGNGSRVVFQQANFYQDLLAPVRAINDGVVRFESGGITAAGAMTADSGGVIEMRATQVTNLEGSIAAVGSNSHVDLFGGTVIDMASTGFFATSNGGVVRNLDLATLEDVTLDGDFVAVDGSTTNVRNSIKGSGGRLQVNGAISPTGVVIGDSDQASSRIATVISEIEVILISNQFSVVTGRTAGSPVVLNHGGSIRGSGRISGMDLTVAASGRVIADGVVSLIGGSQQDVGGRLAINDSTSVLRSGGLLSAEDGGTLEIENQFLANGSAGTVHIQEGSGLIANGVLNFGTFEIALNGSAQLNGALQQAIPPFKPTTKVTGNLIAKAATWDAGTVTIDGEVTITDGDEAVMVRRPAVLDGSGKINGKLVSSGVFAPGKSPGTFTINGDFQQRPGGQLALEMAGATAGTEFDQVVVNGQASLDGTIAIRHVDGFVADVGTEFDVLSATTIEDNGFSLAMLSGGFVQPAVVDLGNGTSVLRLIGTEAVRFAAATGVWDEIGNWTSAGLPSFNDTAFLSGDATNDTTVTGPMADTVLNALAIGRGDDTPGVTTFDLAMGTVTTTHGTTVRRDGRLTGSGTLGGDVYNAGVLGSADALESITIGGDYTQDAEGRAVVALGGTVADAQFSRVSVVGHAALDGVLDVRLVPIDGEPLLEPGVGNAFELLTAASVNGRFSEIDLPTLAPERFWSVDYEDTAVRLEVLSAIQRGDFDGSGQLDITDVDLLMADLVAETQDEQFDINEDGAVSQDDLTMWVKDLKFTWFGDANLDGEFNSGDLVAVLAAGEYEDRLSGNSGWADGDWNGDMEFTSGDLVTALADGGYEQGPRLSVSEVPEPTSAAVLIPALFVLSIVSRTRRMKPSP